MADPAGAILGLLGLYSTCIDVFQHIRVAKTFSRDFEILEARLDGCKCRLLEWGIAVGMAAEDCEGRNPKLDDPAFRPTIEKTLRAIKLLLTQAEESQSKFDTAVSEPLRGDTATSLIPSPVISKRRYSLFKQEYGRYLGKLKKRQNDTSIVTKTKWSYYGQDEFLKVVSNLDALVENLFRLVPVLPLLEKSMIKEDVDSIAEDLRTLKIVKDACALEPGEAQFQRVGQSSHWNRWEEAVSLRIEASESAGQDQSRLQDWLAEVDSVGSLSLISSRQTLDALCNEYKLDSISFVERNSSRVAKIVASLNDPHRLDKMLGNLLRRPFELLTSVPDDTLTEHYSVFLDPLHEVARGLSIDRWKRTEIVHRTDYATVWREECAETEVWGLLRDGRLWSGRQMSSQVRAVKGMSASWSRTGFRPYRDHLFDHIQTSREHSFFVHLYGWYTQRDMMYVAMEFIELGNLSQCVTHPLPEASCKQICLQVCRALRTIHQSDRPRKLCKLENIFVQSKDPWCIKLDILDLASIDYPSTEEKKRSTMVWMSPEQCLWQVDSSAPVCQSRRADVWLLGQLAYWLTTHEVLFPDIQAMIQFACGNTQFPLNALDFPEASTLGISFIKRCCQREPRNRPKLVEVLHDPWLKE